MASVSEENSDADSDVDETSVEEEYKSSLEDLNFNSKPLINVLTMLADENISHADIIINLIASRIKKVCYAIFTAKASLGPVASGLDQLLI